MRIVSLDPGSSYMKAMADGREPFRFPTLAKACGEDYQGALRVDGGCFLVGDRAATAYNTAVEAPHNRPDYHGSPEHRLQICYALQTLGAPPEADLLILSLPYTDHRKQELKAKLRSWRTFSWEVRTAKNGYDELRWERRQTAFKEVLVVPQGVGALEYYCGEHKVRPRVAVFTDIGSCTTDIVTTILNDKGHYAYNYAACDSIGKINVTVFKNLLVDAIASQARGMPRDKRFDYYLLMGMIERGDFNLQVGDKVIDIRPAFNKARSQFRAEIEAAVRETVGDLDPNKIILTGGGAQLVDVEEWGDKRLEKLDVWANVRGQYITGADMLAQRDKERPAELPTHHHPAHSSVIVPPAPASAVAP